MSRVFATTLAAWGCIAVAGCTTYTYNCNVKDACRTTNVDAAAAPATPVASPR